MKLKNLWRMPQKPNSSRTKEISSLLTFSVKQMKTIEVLLVLVSGLSQNLCWSFVKIVNG